MVVEVFQQPAGTMGGVGLVGEVAQWENYAMLVFIRPHPIRLLLLISKFIHDVGVANHDSGVLLEAELSSAGIVLPLQLIQDRNLPLLLTAERGNDLVVLGRDQQACCLPKLVHHRQIA
jgi:hypothetical protein